MIKLKREEVESQEFSSTEVEPRALHVTILHFSGAIDPIRDSEKKL